MTWVDVHVWQYGVAQLLSSISTIITELQDAPCKGNPGKDEGMSHQHMAIATNLFPRRSRRFFLFVVLAHADYRLCHICFKTNK